MKKMQSKGKRRRESTSSQYYTKANVARLEKRMDRMEFLLEELYKFTKSKAIEVQIEDVEIFSPKAARVRAKKMRIRVETCLHPRTLGEYLQVGLANV